MKEKSFGEHIEHLEYRLRKFDRQHLGGKGSYLLGVVSLLTMVLATTDQGNIVRDIEERLDRSHPIPTIEPERSLLLVQRNKQRMNLHNMMSDRFKNDTLLALIGMVGVGISVFLIIRQKQDWIAPINPPSQPDRPKLQDFLNEQDNPVFSELDRWPGPGRRNT